MQPIAEYSTLYPETNSASLQVSQKDVVSFAKADMKNIINIGNNAYHTFFARTISVKFNEPNIKIVIIENLLLLHKII